MSTTEKPILFSGPMVRAILEGRKTMTRRVLKPQPIDVTVRGKRVYADADWKKSWGDAGNGGNNDFRIAVGDRLWVRETWAKVPATAYRCSEGVFQTINPDNPDEAAIYAAGWDRSIPKWKPSIHMSRWMSRITLEVIGVKVERLNEISRGDAMEEGCPFPNMAKGPDPRQWFRDLWKSINGEGSWDLNPWVAAYSFKRIEPSLMVK